MQDMRIIETLTDYQTLKEQEKFSLFLFGSQACAPCKALKEKIIVWSGTHPQVFTGYISIAVSYTHLTLPTNRKV